MSSFELAQIVVLSSVEWDAAWQRHQIFASQFAAAGHEVFFVENSGFRNIGARDLPRVWRKLRGLVMTGPAAATNPRPHGAHIISPIVLPPTYRAFRRTNVALFIPRLVRALRKRGLRPGPIAVVYMPTATTLELLRRLSPSLVVHDCASNFEGHPQAPPDFAATERALLERTDLVVTDSDFLHRRMRARHANVAQIHQGVSEEFFAAAPPNQAFRTFCYYGTWTPDLDPAFLSALDAAGFAVTLSGFVKGAPPALPETIQTLGPVQRRDLVARLEAFDAFLLPHRLTPFHLGVLPAKLYECFAMGRPILSVPLPSLEPVRELLYIAETPADWVRVARDLPRTETQAKREARRALAAEHTHTSEFGRLLELVRMAWLSRAGRAPGGELV